jgi:hypothetical protein
VPLVLIALGLGARALLLHFFEQLGIEDGRADAISSARPLSKIDQTATIAAERKERVSAQNYRLAGGTAQAESLLSGHKAVPGGTFK